MDLAPGDPLVIDEPLASVDVVRSMTESSIRVPVWLVANEASTGVTQTVAYLGEATVFRDGRVLIRAVVPAVVAERMNKFGLAVPRPITQGDYSLEVIRGLAVTVRVTRDGPPVDLRATRPAGIVASRQVLGDAELAGVTFGTRDDDAEQRLVARFGAPTGRRDWSDGCVGQYRWVWWGELVVEFRRADAAADGRLGGYVYGARDWWFQDNGGVPASVLGLGTVANITVGTSVTELRGVLGRAEFRTGYDSFVADRWVSPSGGVVATLDRDFLWPDSRVVRISAPVDTALTVC